MITRILCHPNPPSINLSFKLQVEGAVDTISHSKLFGCHLALVQLPHPTLPQNGTFNILENCQNKPNSQVKSQLNVHIKMHNIYMWIHQLSLELYNSSLNFLHPFIPSNLVLKLCETSCFFLLAPVSRAPKRCSFRNYGWSSTICMASRPKQKSLAPTIDFESIKIQAIDWNGNCINEKSSILSAIHHLWSGPICEKKTYSIRVIGGMRVAQ